MLQTPCEVLFRMGLRYAYLDCVCDLHGGGVHSKQDAPRLAQEYLVAAVSRDCRRCRRCAAFCFLLCTPAAAVLLVSVSFAN